MTTKQLAARVRKYYRLYGSIPLNGMKIPDIDGEFFTLDRLCDDDGVGVMCVGDKWFIPVEELTYRELSKILKMFNVKKDGA